MLVSLLWYVFEVLYYKKFLKHYKRKERKKMRPDVTGITLNKPASAPGVSSHMPV